MGSEKPPNAEQAPRLTLLEEYWQRLLSQNQDATPPAGREEKAPAFDVGYVQDGAANPQTRPWGLDA